MCSARARTRVSRNNADGSSSCGNDVRAIVHSARPLTAKPELCVCVCVHAGNCSQSVPSTTTDNEELAVHIASHPVHSIHDEFIWFSGGVSVAKDSAKLSLQSETKVFRQIVLTWYNARERKYILKVRVSIFYFNVHWKHLLTTRFIQFVVRIESSKRREGSSMMLVKSRRLSLPRKIPFREKERTPILEAPLRTIAEYKQEGEISHTGINSWSSLTRNTRRKREARAFSLSLSLRGVNSAGTSDDSKYIIAATYVSWSTRPRNRNDETATSVCAAVARTSFLDFRYMSTICRVLASRRSRKKEIYHQILERNTLWRYFKSDKMISASANIYF